MILILNCLNKVSTTKQA